MQEYVYFDFYVYAPALVTTVIQQYRNEAEYNSNWVVILKEN